MVIQPQYQPVKLAASAFGVLSLTTLLAATIFTNTSTYADDEPTNTTDDVVTITVQSSCTLASEGNNHSGTLTPTQYSEDIGTTKVTITCNDPEGFAVYAVGYGNNKWNNNKLTSTTDTISTADKGTTTDSHWYMKIFGASDGVTVHNDFTSEKAVPGGDDESDEDGFTKVISYASTTGKPSSTSFKTTYGAFAAANQTAGTYSGKVKYTLVNPHKSNDNNKPKSADAKVYMQDLTNDSIAALLPNVGNKATVVDSRDNTEYTIAKLADNKYWMLDNLALDISSVSLDNLKGKTNAKDATLNYLKNGGGSGQYPANGVVADTVDNHTWTSNTYETPHISLSGTCYNANCVNDPTSGQWSKDAVATHVGDGGGKIGIYYNYCTASAGSYCYASASGVDKADTLIDAEEDICPAGWRIPTSNIDDGEYVKLYAEYESADEFKAALSIPLSGVFSSGSARAQGSNGRFWSSTYYNDDSVYYLSVSASSADPTSHSNRFYGYSVRCVFGG